MVHALHQKSVYAWLGEWGLNSVFLCCRFLVAASLSDGPPVLYGQRRVRQWDGYIAEWGVDGERFLISMRARVFRDAAVQLLSACRLLHIYPKRLPFFSDKPIWFFFLNLKLILSKKNSDFPINKNKKLNLIVFLKKYVDSSI